MSMEISAPVKSVTCDSVTVWLRSANPILPEKCLHLSDIDVPRLATRPSDTDEAWAWQAREFLRKTLVAEVVTLRKDATVAHRDYGRVYLKKDGSSVAKMLVERGLAKVRRRGQAEPTAEVEELLQAQKEAESKKLGVWNTDPRATENSIRHHHDSASDPRFLEKFVAENLNKQIPGIVEWVRDAGFAKVYLPEQKILSGVSINGIICDQSRRGEDGNLVAEPFAEAGKFFVEMRLLQRDVAVRVEGADSFGTIFGSIMLDGKNIAPRLLQVGLARLSETRLRSVPDPAAYRAAVKEAQVERAGRWKNWQPPLQEMTKEYTAKVIEVHSGDSITVLTLPADGSPSVERRLYLASLRAPKMGGRLREDERGAFEAKELLRKTIVGKKVKIAVQYTRVAAAGTTGQMAPPTSDSQGRMHFVNVVVEQTKKDVSELLVSEGLARVLSFRTEEEAAHNIDVLQELEAAATQAGKGMHAKTESKAPKISELLGADNAERARSYEGELRRKGQLEGIIEHCFNAALFKIRLPTMRIAIKMQIAGIWVPQLARPPHVPTDEPFGAEALNFAREHILQREVTLVVEACERSGVFAGILRVGGNLFATQLLAKGYASVLNGTMIRAKTTVRDQLVAAEKPAREGKIGIWSADLENKVDEAAEAARQYPYTIQAIQIAHINSIASFYILNEPNLELERLQSDLAGTVHNFDKFTAGSPVKRGDFVVALFTADSQWYRALITNYDREAGEANVFFVDYGNAEVVEIDQLRRCPPDFQPSRLPYQAKHCKLSGLKEATETADDAAQFLHSSCEGLSVECVVEGVERSETGDLIQLVTLTAGGDSASVNERLAEQGLSFVNRKTADKKLVDAQQLAKKKRLQLWRHGDVEVLSEDEDRDRGARGWGRR